MDLHERLQDISGVGPSTAEEIEMVVAEYEAADAAAGIEAAARDAVEYLDAGQPDHARDALTEALD